MKVAYAIVGLIVLVLLVGGASLLLDSADIDPVGSDSPQLEEMSRREVPVPTTSHERTVPSNVTTRIEDTQGNAAPDARAPRDLSLPFSIEDINATRGGVNPLGVVRTSRDRDDIGHSGIDIPLFQGATIRAVADGEIVVMKSAGDPWGGMGIFQLLTQTAPGEGWGFIYEHVTPRPDLSIGSVVRRGDVIAVKTPPEGFTAHFQYSKLFNDFQFTSDVTCWPEYLDAGGTQALEVWWNTYRRTTPVIDGWATIFEEGAYPFRGLLDEEIFPDGPQLCYTLGTNVR